MEEPEKILEKIMQFEEFYKPKFNNLIKQSLIDHHIDLNDHYASASPIGQSKTNGFKEIKQIPPTQQQPIQSQSQSNNGTDEIVIKTKPPLISSVSHPTMPSQLANINRLKPRHQHKATPIFIQSPKKDKAFIIDPNTYLDNLPSDLLYDSSGSGGSKNNDDGDSNRSDKSSGSAQDNLNDYNDDYLLEVDGGGISGGSDDDEFEEEDKTKLDPLIEEYDSVSHSIHISKLKLRKLDRKMTMAQRRGLSSSKLVKEHSDIKIKIGQLISRRRALETHDIVKKHNKEDNGEQEVVFEAPISDNKLVDDTSFAVIDEDHEEEEPEVKTNENSSNSQSHSQTIDGFDFNQYIDGINGGGGGQVDEEENDEDDDDDGGGSCKINSSEDDDDDDDGGGSVKINNSDDDDDDDDDGGGSVKINSEEEDDDDDGGSVKINSESESDSDGGGSVELHDDVKQDENWVNKMDLTEVDGDEENDDKKKEDNKYKMNEASDPDNSGSDSDGGGSVELHDVEQDENWVEDMNLKDLELNNEEEEHKPNQSPSHKNRAKLTSYKDVKKDDLGNLKKKYRGNRQEREHNKNINRLDGPLNLNDLLIDDHGDNDVDDIEFALMSYTKKKSVEDNNDESNEYDDDEEEEYKVEDYSIDPYGDNNNELLPKLKSVLLDIHQYSEILPAVIEEDDDDEEDDEKCFQTIEYETDSDCDSNDSVVIKKEIEKVVSINELQKFDTV